MPRYRSAAGSAGLLLLLGFGITSQTYCQRQPALSSGVMAKPAAAGAPRLNSWRILGPGGGSAQYNAAVSPHDSNLVFVSTDMTGCFVSEDGGSSWRMFNLRFTCRFTFDPKDPNVVYAAASGAGLYRTEDRGRTWSIVYPTPESLDQILMLEDEGEPNTMTKAGWHHGITALAIDPTNTDLLYAASGSELLHSRDRGRSWKVLTDMVGGSYKLWVDPNSPAENRAVISMMGNYVGLWQDGKWSRSPDLYTNAWFYDSTCSFPKDAGPPACFAITDLIEKDGKVLGGLIVTRDLGKTWEQIHPGFFALRTPGAPNPIMVALGVPRNRPDVIYLSYQALRTPESGEKAYFGVAKSTNGGQAWELLWKDTDVPSPNVKDPWLNERFGTDWGENPLQISVHPDNPDLVFTTDLGRTMRSTDGGKTWEGVYSKRFEDGTFTSTGIDVTSSYGVHFDPFNPNRMFIAYTDIGLFRSENGGVSWIDSWQGCPREWRNTAYSVEFDPAVQGRMWMGVSRIHDLPRLKMMHKLNPEQVWQGGVCRSDDGGLTWRKSTEGMPQAPVTHLVADPKSSAEKRVLYAVGLGSGVYKSADGGNTWTLKNQGLPEGRAMFWRLHLDARGTLYLVVARRESDAAVGSGKEGMLYRSRDGAETWERMALPDGLNGPTGVASDPENPDRLYLTSFGKYKLYDMKKADLGGVYLSTDAGKTWRNVHGQDQHLYDVTVDPRAPNQLYATGYEASAWRSSDRGETWSRLRGFNFKMGHRIIPDPRNPDKIFITTYGSSVWYGSAEGEATEVDEDIVAPSAARFFKPAAGNRGRGKDTGSDPRSRKGKSD